VCTLSEPAAPASTAQALAMVSAGLGYLTACDAPALSTAAQAEALVGLARAEAQHTAARARILAAFTVQHGYEADGQFGARPWLRSFTKVTKTAAAATAAWASRLAAHPAIAGALAEGRLSPSWARQICDWTDQLPQQHRADADAILLAAACGGADLHDLGALAREMIDRSRTSPDRDSDRFDERALWLETTLGGAGRLQGDLTPACAAALTVVLDALGQKAGPEDIRTATQRRHDALDEACRRLIAAQMIPGRDGQPAHLQVHIDLAALRGLPGGSALEAGWSPARAAAAPGSVYLTGPDADAAACDAAITPVVTGQLDWTILHQLTDLWLTHHANGDTPATADGADRPRPGDVPPAQDADRPRSGDALSNLAPAGYIPPGTRQRLQASLLQWSIDLLSGPGGLASYLRTGLVGVPFTGLSQPLDLGRSTRTVPPHLRAAVIRRDQHCQFAGCRQPPSVCEVHHIIPWAKGGPTSLNNLGLYCRFHHLIVIHRWGWQITRHPDGTTTATSPDGRVLHSHSPPRQTA